MLPATVERRTASTLARVVAFGLLYAVGAELGHFLSTPNQVHAFATFWPPAGLFLAVLTVSRYRLWLPMVLAACAANLISDVLLHDKSVVVGIGFCAANSLEACLGAWMLRRFCADPFSLTSPKNVVALTCGPALFGSLVGAALGAGVVAWAYTDVSYRLALQSWWIADAIGILVVAPVVIAWSAETPQFLKAIRPSQWAESALLFVGLILATELVCGNWLPRSIRVPVFILPFLLWAGLRLGPRSAASAVLVVSLIGVWNSSRGRGPLIVESAPISEHILRSQGTLAIMSVCVHLLAAIVAERKQAERERSALLAELQKALAEIKTLWGLIPICAWCKRIRDDQNYWHSVENYVSAHTEAKFSHAMCPDCLEKALGEVPKRAT